MIFRIEFSLPSAEASTIFLARLQERWKGSENRIEDKVRSWSNLFRCARFDNLSCTYHVEMGQFHFVIIVFLLRVEVDAENSAIQRTFFLNFTHFPGLRSPWYRLFSCRYSTACRRPLRNWIKSSLSEQQVVLIRYDFLTQSLRVLAEGRCEGIREVLECQVANSLVAARSSEQ